MRKAKIGVMDFHGSVDITDPCYDKDVWCRMNNVKISERRICLLCLASYRQRQV